MKQEFPLIRTVSVESFFHALKLGERPLLDKPERWARVYRRWGFKHRERCGVCQTPHQTGYLTCLRVMCVLHHMASVGYRERTEIDFAINYRNEQD
jgi:hypothetical protein